MNNKINEIEQQINNKLESINNKELVENIRKLFDEADAIVKKNSELNDMIKALSGEDAKKNEVQAMRRYGCIIMRERIADWMIRNGYSWKEYVTINKIEVPEEV